MCFVGFRWYLIFRPQYVELCNGNVLLYILLQTSHNTQQFFEDLSVHVLSSVPLSAPTRLQALFSVDSASISWQKPLSDQGQSSL